MKIVNLLFVSLAIVAVESVASAAEPTGFRRSLFDGKSLNGWTLENDCEADVVGECLRLKSGLGWLRHDSRLRDFELHVEWMALKPAKYDAGIYIRCSSLDGKPFPKTGYQVNLLDGKEGNIPNLKGAESKGLAKSAGEWNSFDLRVVGESAALKINGKPAWEATGLKELDGWMGFQIEVPNGGQFLLKNIEVVELGYESLFNGRDFSGWVSSSGMPEEGWSAADGILACTGKVHKQWLRSVAEYGDFNLRLDYLASAHTNSGVYIRVPENGNHHRENESQPPAGIEIQVLDDTAPEHANLKDFQYSASIYDFAGAKPHLCRPLGEWNSLEINCRGQQITTWHNGVKVASVSGDENPLLNLRSTKGFLGLQNHNTVVQFRNIRIGSAVEVPTEASP